MRRLLMGVPDKKQDLDIGLSSNSILTGSKMNSSVELEKALRVPRSKIYIEYIKKLDADVHHHNKTLLEELRSNLRSSVIGEESEQGLLQDKYKRIRLTSPRYGYGERSCSKLL